MKRVRFITDVAGQSEVAAESIAEGIRLVEGCLTAVVLPDVFGNPSKLYSYFPFSPALAGQEGAKVTE